MKLNISYPFSSFLLLLATFFLSFLTAYGFGSLNPVVIITLAGLLLIALMQEGKHLLSFKQPELVFLSVIFSIIFALILTTKNRIRFENISGNYHETTIDSFAISQLVLFIAILLYFFLVLQYVQILLPKMKVKLERFETQDFPFARYFISLTLLLLVCWSPYALTLYPGVVLPDSLSSVAQAMGDRPINNHHPVLFTLIVKFFVHDLPVRSINHSVFLFSIMQSILLAATISYSLCWLLKKKVNKFVILLATSYFALAPVFPIYALNMQKDILFSAVCLIFSLTLFDFVVEKKVTFIRKLIVILFALLTTYLRNNGLYVVVGTWFIALVISLKDRQIKSISQVIAGYLLLTVLVIQPLMTRYTVPTASAERLGVPMQQVTRAIVMDGDLAKDDLALMDKILPLQDYEAYTPSLADPIKWHKNFDNTFLDEHNKEFLLLWGRNLQKNLSIYTDAYILETFGFWIPGVKNDYGFLDIRVNTNNYGITQSNLIERFTGISGTKKLIDARNFFGSGTLFWLLIFSVFLLLSQKKYRFLLLLSPGILVFLTIMIATPVAFSLRYVFILALGLPIYLLIPFIKFDFEKKKGAINYESI
ncbi:DUF6020 family protein [Candidatus Enterococcus courvalinii]|uniref:Glycosyltransferase RgtA/B/C/D-like domain-containing protein n=1 Tax=Candidatus Enterococcus courvalinii TaxID=2815329 RepID=A0ABS3I206_9ENTE|nr:DUF6020 family protein [Enterococcus sp. MSG2901]MBO0482750.1 hypothetical protein [Enterococcus sp. MSG2901]